MLGFLPVGPTSIVQGGVAAVVLSAVAWSPPSQGTMLIVPVLPAARPAVMATRSGALILSMGSLPGSVVVIGTRSQILPAAVADGDIVIATGARGCAGGSETSS